MPYRYIPNELEGIITSAHLKLTVKKAEEFSIINGMCKEIHADARTSIINVITA